MNKEKYVKICPKCKSTDIAFEKSTMQALGLLPNRYVCGNCGYGGFYVVEAEVSKLEELEADPALIATEKHEFLDTVYGNFQVRVMWKLFSPVLILIGVFLLKIKPAAAAIMILAGMAMFYIAYIKKRKLKE